MYPTPMRRKTIPVGAILGFVLIVVSLRYHSSGWTKVGLAMMVASIVYGHLFYGRKARF